MADASVVITTHNALPWIEQCLESVAALDTVVVDNASSDDTVAFVRERFPAVGVVEQENLGPLNLGIAKWLKDNKTILRTETSVGTVHVITAKELKALIIGVKNEKTI